MLYRFLFSIACCLCMLLEMHGQQQRLALLKYNGGGDWYANPTALKNLAIFCNQQLKTNFNPQEIQIEPSSPQIFNYPFVHMTGHGRFAFNAAEVANMRLYLEAGGFLHIDDNYGMDEFVKSEMKKVFPELSFVELPHNHPIYHQRFKFPNGLPKIHQHDGKPPAGLGLIYKGRLVCYYTYSTDLGDGWEDAEVHNNSAEKRTQALQMGANIIQFVFNQHGKS